MRGDTTGVVLHLQKDVIKLGKRKQAGKWSRERRKSLGLRIYAEEG